MPNMAITHQNYPVEELWVDTVGVRTVEADWDVIGGEYREGFTSYEAPSCDDGYAEWDANDHAWKCNGSEVEEDSEGPMMNYYYPLPDLRRIGDDPHEAASRISDLPLCVIEFQDGNYALALTGGGMDLSWEICEAFTRLGFLPPLHFCDLPKMAGKTIDEDARYVIRACLRSADVAEGWAKRTRERLSEQYPED